MDLAKAKTLIEGNQSLDLTAVRGPKEDDTPESDAAIAAIEAWFAEDVSVWRDLPVSEFAGHLELTGLLDKAQAGAENVALTDEQRAVCARVVRIATGRTQITTFDTDDAEKRPVILGMLKALVAAGVWTQGEADSVEALAKATVPRWQAEEVGLIGRGAIINIGRR